MSRRKNDLIITLTREQVDSTSWARALSAFGLPPDFVVDLVERGDLPCTLAAVDVQNWEALLYYGDRSGEP